MTTPTPAAASPLSQSAETLPGSIARWRDAALVHLAAFGEVLYAIVAAPYILVRAFLRLDYNETLGWYCDECRYVHRDDEECPRALVADCIECVGVVDIVSNRCLVSPYHAIANRRSKFFHEKEVNAID